MRKITQLSKLQIPWMSTKTFAILLVGLFLQIFQIQAQTFNYTGSVQSVTLPAGDYEIEM